MSNTDIKTSDIPATTTLANTDLLLVVRSPDTNNSTTNTMTLNSFRAVIPIANTPANSVALTIQSGTFLYDSNYLYIAVANNVVKRVSLSSF